MRIIWLILILIIFTITPKGDNSEEKSLLCYLEIYKNNSVNLKKISLVDAKPTFIPNISGDYSFQITSIDDNIIYEKSFDITFQAYSGEELIDLEKTIIFLRLPFFYSAKEIRLIYKDAVIYTIDIAKEICKSDEKDGLCFNFCLNKVLDPDCVVCGNLMCETGENYKNCPQDCSAPTTTTIETMRKEEPSAPLFLILSLLAILLLAILIVFFKLKKSG